MRKCFFSITRDEMNHEECCQRSDRQAVAGRTARLGAGTDLERAAHNNIGWLYHNGGRYWSGYNSAVGKYTLPVLFTSFMMGEMAASTLFRGMASGTQHPVFSRDVPADRPRRVPPPADLHDDPGERVARPHRRPPVD